MSQVLRRVLRPFIQFARRVLLHADIYWIKLVNRYSHACVTSPEGPVVSIATYGKRLMTAYLTIESVARGNLRPARLLLWVDDPAEFASLPVQLTRLQARGLEVKLSDRNYGPHKKYYPYIMSRAVEDLPGKDRPLVTADDDIVYPRSWLQLLATAYKHAPGLVQCYRARVINMQDAAMQPYSTWELCRSVEPSFLTFAIGVSGVMYPPRLQDLLYQAGRTFEQTCPRADDLWLHVNAIRNGFRVRQLSSNPIHFPMIPGTQQDGLQQQNLHNQGNDEQIRKTYQASDVQRLWFASTSST